MASWAREAFELKAMLLDGREGFATCAAHGDPRIRPAVGRIRKDSRDRMFKWPGSEKQQQQ